MNGSIFGVLAPTLICAGLGYLWARLEQPYDVRLITRIIMMVGAPCLIFSTLLKTDVALLELGEVALIALLALAIFAAIGAATLTIFRLPIAAYLPPLTFHNAGNVGLPICFFAFGETGLAIGVAYFTVSATTHYTIGAWVYSGKSSPISALKTPLPYTVALAVLLLATEAAPPPWLLNTTGLLGQMTIPLMLMTLGVSLARLGVSRLPRSAALAAFRLAMGIGVGFALAELFGLTGIARGVVILQASMPAAVLNYLLAQHFERNAEEAASVIVLSSLLAVGTLPFVLWLVL